MGVTGSKGVVQNVLKYQREEEAEAARLRDAYDREVKKYVRELYRDGGKNQAVRQARFRKLERQAHGNRMRNLWLHTALDHVEGSVHMGISPETALESAGVLNTKTAIACRDKDYVTVDDTGMTRCGGTTRCKSRPAVNTPGTREWCDTVVRRARSHAATSSSKVQFFSS
jgi:hypothetical protein